MKPIDEPRNRSNSLTVLLVLAMMTTTYLPGGLAVLSGFLLEDFDISRAQLGLVFTASTLLGSVAAPVLGALADRGTRRAMTLLFAVAGLGTLLSAAAPNYTALVAAATLGGIAGGFANPVTNRIISEQVPVHGRGLVIGLKQAGPPLSIFVTGLILPTVAALTNWRIALAFGLPLISVAGLLATRALLPPRSSPTTSREKIREMPRQLRASVWWLTAIGFWISFGNGAVLAFMPLYAIHEVGMTATTAGLVMSVMGATAVIGRIGWGSQGSRFRRPSTGLIIIPVVSAIAMLAIGASAPLGAALLWFGAIASGASARAWHSMAWLVIIGRLKTDGIGRASGVMQTGSGLGFAIGPLAVGVLIDVTGSYGPAWVTLAVVSAAVTIMTIRFRMDRSLVG